MSDCTRRSFLVGGGLGTLALGLGPRPDCAERGLNGAFVAGKGEPLVLVHGLGASGEIWSRVIADLARHFRVLAPTLPGHAGGPSSPSGATLQEHVDFIAGILERDPDFKHAHVAGFSIGGSIALEVARRGVARSACAIGPGNHTYTGALKQANQGIAARLAAAAEQLGSLEEAAQDPQVRKAELALIALHGERTTPEEFIQFVNQQLACKVMIELLSDTQPLEPMPMPANCPITLVWGEQDLLFPNVPNVAVARRNVPGAMFVEIPDAGHATLIDQPALTADVIRFAASL